MPDLDQLLPEFVRGGPTDALLGFEEAYTAVYKGEKRYGGFLQHPLYVELKKAQGKKAGAEAPSTKPGAIKAEFIMKRQKKCDEVFAEYLLYASEIVNADYYKDGVTKFVLLYRECLNHFGTRLSEERKKLPEVLTIQQGTTKADLGVKPEYCLENNAEQAPDISNEFMGMYLPRDGALRPEDAKQLTYHFCTWLFVNGYTCSMVSLAQKERALSLASPLSQPQMQVQPPAKIESQSMSLPPVSTAPAQSLPTAKAQIQPAQKQ